MRGYVHNMFAHHGLRGFVTQIDFPWVLRVDMSKADEDGDFRFSQLEFRRAHADGDQPRPPDRRLSSASSASAASRSAQSSAAGGGGAASWRAEQRRDSRPEVESL